MKKIFSSQWSKKIIFWYFLGFLWSFTRKTPENLKKQSVSIIVSIFVKKISPNNVRDFFFLLFIREKKICLWTLWNFLWPSATRNFKIGFTRKCSSHSWTGEKRSLTVGEIFFTQKRDNYTNKVLLTFPNDNRACFSQAKEKKNSKPDLPLASLLGNERKKSGTGCQTLKPSIMRWIGTQVPIDILLHMHVEKKLYPVFFGAK